MALSPQQKIAALLKIAEAKNNGLDEALRKLSTLLDSDAGSLANTLAKEILRNLEVKDGKITTSSENLLKALGASATIDRFMQRAGVAIVQNLKRSLQRVTDSNADYFRELNNGKLISSEQIDKIVNARLGLTETGEIKKTGFMASLASPDELKRVIVDFLSEKISANTGFNELSKGLRELVAGKDGEDGAFKKYYRNTVADTVAKVDALNSQLYAQKLKLKYFIYAGTRREHSRYFCIQRKGKVFSSEEAQEWHKLIGTTTQFEGKTVPAGPIVTNEDITTYNPFIDRGGYGCVDDVNWISEELAFALRPDLKKGVNLK